MAFLKILLVLILLFIIQSVCIPLISIHGIAPDVLLVFLVYWSYRHNRFQGTLLGFITGFIQDLTGPGIAGIFALSKSIACYTAGSFTKNRYELNPVFLGVVLFMATLLHHLITAVADHINASSGLLSSVFRYVIPSALYTAIIGIGVYCLIKWIHQQFRRQ